MWALGLNPEEKVKLRIKSHATDKPIVMRECLSLWRKNHPHPHSLRALLKVLLSLSKESVASKVCESFSMHNKKQRLSGTCTYNT